MKEEFETIEMGDESKTIFKCECGRRVVLPDKHTLNNPYECACPWNYYTDDGRVVRIPGRVMPALVLDLDGTVRYSKDGKFINKPEDIALFDGVEDKLWAYRDSGYLIFGVTNQGGVAHGFKTLWGYDDEIETMFDLFDRNPFHIVKACFHHEDGKIEPYNHRSLLRKPDTGMLALCEWEAFDGGYVVDWDNSVMVGDMKSDQECARNAGIAFRWAWDFFGRPKLEEM